MQEPYKSCWECEFCNDLNEHLVACYSLKKTIDRQEAYLRMMMEKNRAKLKR